jgi:tRNA(Arg) A34 adenosine deaminase TadA
MCFTAIHWARIDKIIYGAGIDDAKEFGFNELTVSNQELKTEGGSRVEIVKGFMRDDCRKLFEYWAKKGIGRTY